MDLFHFDDDFRSFRRKEKAKKRSCLFINIYSCLNDICVKLNRELFDWELLVRYFFFFFYTRGSRNSRNKVLEHWFIVVQSIISIAWKLIFIRYPSLGRDDGGV